MHSIGQFNSKQSVAFGKSSPFQLALASIGGRGRKKASSICALGPLKVDIVQLERSFEAVFAGTYCEVGEFQFEHPSGYLIMGNLTAASGVIPHPSNAIAIPVVALTAETQQAITNIIQKSVAL